MWISAYEPCTLVDFPGKIATIVFTPGCNLRCGYCHNSELVLPEKIRKYRERKKEAEFFHFLESRKGLLDGVSICGGEPTLHTDLSEFCHRVKSMGFLVKLDTNGTHPEVIETLLSQGVIDCIAMDIKHVFHEYSSLTGVPVDPAVYRQSIQLIRESGIEYEFRSTIISGVHTLEHILEMAEYIRGASRYFLQNFRTHSTLDPDFSGEPFSRSEM